MDRAHRYMLITIAVEVQWVALAPVARAAERFYGTAAGSAFGIDFLAMAYLLLFLVFSFPASYVIDTFGIRVGLGLGAVTEALGGIAKGLFPASFAAVLAGQIGLGIFNALSSMVDAVAAHIGVVDSDGLIGTVV